MNYSKEEGVPAVDCKTRALELLQEHEGLELRPYTCPAGALTIGYGRNLEAKGITEDEAYYMLSNDVDECMTDLQAFPFWFNINACRQAVLIDMRYNLGATGFRKFVKMIEALERYDYHKAAVEILDSKAATSEHRGLRQRYNWNAKLMRDGF